MDRVPNSQPGSVSKMTNFVQLYSYLLVKIKSFVQLFRLMNLETI